MRARMETCISARSQVLQNNVAPTNGQKLSSNRRPNLWVQGSVQPDVASECW